MSKSLLAGALSVAMSAALTVVLAGSVAASMRPEPVSAAVGSTVDEPTALQTAKLQGRDVEVESARTVSATVYATPKGTLRLVQSLRPIRTKQNGGWVPVNPTLRFNPDGTVSPVAATVPMTFSGGGATAMAAIGADREKVTIGWPTALPRPVLSGATALYPEVLAGVDLKITADVDGFNHVLIVKTPAAAANPALSLVDYPITTDRVALGATVAGVVTGKDARGAEVFRGTASAWDTPHPAVRKGAVRADDSAEPGEATTRTAAVSVANGHLTVRPDQALLHAPAQNFPIHIDPGWQYVGLNRNSWMAVFDHQGGPLYNQPIYASDNGAKGEVKVGKTPAAADDYFVARAMFQFDTSGIAYKHVNRAWISINQLWSSSWCGDGTTRRTLLQSINDYTPSTTWYNQPGWFDTYGYSDALRFVGSGGCPAGPVEFNASGFMQVAANNGWAHASMGLRASNEGDTSSWKRYQLSSMSLSVEYNSYPNAPDSLVVEGQGCVPGTTLYVNNPQPELRARVTDPDGGSSLTGYIDFTNLGTNAHDYVWQDALPSGASVVKRMPAGWPDGTYRIQSHSQDGIDWSQWSGACDFVLDRVKPPAPTAVSADIYPADPNLHNGVGRVGNFSFTPPSDISDIAGYKYALTPNTDVSSSTYVAADPVTKKVTVPIVPMMDGPLELRVWTVDRANNASATFYSYKFNTTVGSGPAGRWKFDGGFTDASGHGNTLTPQGDATLAGARGGVGQALGVSGNTGSAAATAGQLQGRHPDTNAVTPFRTDTSFSVAAWVRLDRGGIWQTAVSVDGVRDSSFFLRMVPGPDRWAFTLPPSDTDNAAYVQALSSTAPVLGRWTYIAGVYDAPTKQARLYVNGQLAGTVAVPSTFSATGPVLVGRAKWNGNTNTDWLKGGIDDVQIWDRVVTDTELRALAAPLKVTVELSATSVTPGTAVSATFKANGDTNVVKYQYQVDGGAVQTATPAVAGDPATVNVGAFPPGPHKVTGWSVDTTNNPGQINRADFVVREAPRISGTVYDSVANGPAAGVTVSVSPGGYTATTAADGSYTVTGMPAGHYTVSATIGGKRCGLFAGTELDVPEPVNMDLILQPQSDGFGYTCTEETRTFVEGDVANLVNLTGDDKSAPLALPFAFPFYGQTYTTAYLSTNGVIAFAPIDVIDAENNPVPSAAKPNAAIYPYWTDLQMTPFPNSSIVTKQITDGGVNAFIIHYHGMRVYGQPLRVDFSVTLYANGKIVVNYSKLDPASELERGNTSTIGLENGDGSTGFLYSYNEPVLADNHAIVFYPPGVH